MTDVAKSPGEPHPGISASVQPPRVLRLRPKSRYVPAIAAPAPGSTKSKSESAAPARPVASSTGPSVPPNTWKRLILTLDGGGIRGFSSLIILRALMREINRLELATDPPAPSSAHTPRIPRDLIPDHVYREGEYLPCHYFDYIAGTSLGGLVAIMLGMFGMNVEDVITEFRRQHDAILLPMAATDDSSVASVIDLPIVYNRRNTWPIKQTRAFFDAFARFAAAATTPRTNTGTSFSSAASSSSSSATCAPTTAAHSSAAVSSASRAHSSSQVSTASTEFRKDVFKCQTLAWCSEVKRSRGPGKNKTQVRPYAFCSFAEDESEDAPSITIPEVAKAITNPSRFSFKPFQLGHGHFVDGSRLVRDPTLEVLKELSELFDETDLEKSPPIDLLLSLGSDEQHSWIYEKLRSFLPLSSATPNKEQQAEEIRNAKDRAYSHYHRFEVPAIKLGWRRKSYLEEIERATEAWLAEPQQKELIIKYATMLVERRRFRAQTARWETFALGVRYVCFHKGCIFAPKTPEETETADGEDQQQQQEQKDDERESMVKLFTSRGDFFEHLDRRHALTKMAARGLADFETELDKGRRFGCV
ncbi:hypothetical protein VTJ04DRAFT_6517 [Mycothermus thermophilus]|uniref:uncharacterized protein n=1 Tax=Humicola insolens TaxID=85995 RepID=UPI003742C509